MVSINKMVDFDLCEHVMFWRLVWGADATSITASRKFAHCAVAHRPRALQVAEGCGHP
jgi:hypothetical protein